MFTIKSVFYIIAAVLSLLGMIFAGGFLGSFLFGEVGLVLGFIVGAFVGVIPFAYFYKRLMNTHMYRYQDPTPPDPW